MAGSSDGPPTMNSATSGRSTPSTRASARRPGPVRRSRTTWEAGLVEPDHLRPDPLCKVPAASGPSTCAWRTPQSRPAPSRQSDPLRRSHSRSLVALGSRSSRRGCTSANREPDAELGMALGTGPKMKAPPVSPEGPFRAQKSGRGERFNARPPEPHSLRTHVRGHFRAYMASIPSTEYPLCPPVCGYGVWVCVGVSGRPSRSAGEPGSSRRARSRKRDRAQWTTLTRPHTAGFRAESGYASGRIRGTVKEAWTGAETMNVPDPVELDDPRRYLQRILKTTCRLRSANVALNGPSNVAFRAVDCSCRPRRMTGP